MADKRLAEQNARWLLAVHTQTAEIQASIVDELSRCNKDNPASNWGRIEDLMKRANATVIYAIQEAERRRR